MTTLIVIVVMILLAAVCVFVLACFAHTPPNAKHRRQR